MNNYSLIANEILHRVDISRAVQFYGLQFNSHGYAVCPFHKEVTPSFKIQGQYAHCFGCGWNHNIIKFVEEMFGLDFPSALEKINSDFGLGLPVNRRPTLREQRDAQRRYDKMQAERSEQNRKAAYSLEQFNRLLCYKAWLSEQNKTEAIIFDLGYIDRMLERYQNPKRYIEWDAVSRIEALLTKHDNCESFKWIWCDTDNWPPTEFFEQGA